MMAKDRLRQQCIGDRRRVGQSGGFDDDAAEMRDLAARPPRQQIAQRLLQIAAHRAAQAAVFKQQRAFRHALQQMMVEPDLAEFVDQHGDVGQFRDRSRRRSSVVLPQPRKPVMMLTGVRSP